MALKLPWCLPNPTIAFENLVDVLGVVIGYPEILRGLVYGYALVLYHVNQLKSSFIADARVLALRFWLGLRLLGCLPLGLFCH